MAVQKGYDAQIKIGSNVVAYGQSWSLNMSFITGDITALGEYDKSYTVTGRDGTASIEFVVDESDTAQGTLFTQLTATTPTDPTLVLVSNSTVGSLDGWTCTAVLTGITLNATQTGLQTGTANFQIDGGVTAYSS